MFEQQYNALWTAADEVAERIRTLDVVAPSTAPTSVDSTTRPG